MKKQAWLILCLIALVAGLALAATNMVTAGPIEEQRVKATQAARTAVFPDASSFEEMPDTAAGFDSILEAKSGSDTIGYVLQITVPGYAGPIEIIMGVDLQGTITGLSVGGSKFSETAGLGTQVREPTFTDQFVGLSEMPTLNGNVDTISGATISSSAVINGVIRCYKQWEALVGADVSGSAAQTNPNEPSYEDGLFIGEAAGFIGPIRVSVEVKDGLIAEIKVLTQSDTAALFAMARDAILPAVVKQNGTQGVDAVSGATYSSQGLLDAIDNALCGTCAEKGESQAEQAQYANGTLIGEAQGFTGAIRVSVTVDNGTISSVKVLGQHDTDAIFAMARDAVLPAVLQSNGTRGIDTVTGATYSSQGLLDAIDNALSAGVLSTDVDEPESGAAHEDGTYIGEAQGYLDKVKVAVTVNGGAITAVRVLSQGDTDAIFAMARESVIPAVIAANGTEGVDTVSGATYSSQGLLDAVSEALCSECSETAGAASGALHTDGVFEGEAQGYMGAVKVAVAVQNAAITDIKVLSHDDTDAIFAVAKDAIVPAVIAANSTGGVDTATGATYSSQGLLDAIANALDKPAPANYRYTDGVYEGEAPGYNGEIEVSVTIQNGKIARIDVLESGDNATMFSMVEDTIIPGVVAANTTNGVDAVSDATYSSRGLLGAIADALSKAVSKPLPEEDD